MLEPGFKVLDDRERMILHLRFFKGLTQSQIAQQIGISQMHVSRLIRRSLEKIRAEIAADEVEPGRVAPQVGAAWRSFAPVCGTGRRNIRPGTSTRSGRTPGIRARRSSCSTRSRRRASWTSWPSGKEVATVLTCDWHERSAPELGERLGAGVHAPAGGDGGLDAQLFEPGGRAARPASRPTRPHIRARWRSGSPSWARSSSATR